MPPKLRKSHVDLSSFSDDTNDGTSQQRQLQRIRRDHSPGRREVDNESVGNFIQITGATKDLARHYLEVSQNW